MPGALQLPDSSGGAVAAVMEVALWQPCKATPFAPRAGCGAWR